MATATRERLAALEARVAAAERRIHLLETWATDLTNLVLNCMRLGRGAWEVAEDCAVELGLDFSAAYSYAFGNRNSIPDTRPADLPGADVGSAGAVTASSGGDHRPLSESA